MAKGADPNSLPSMRPTARPYCWLATDIPMLRAQATPSLFHRKYAGSVNGVTGGFIELAGYLGLAGISSTESHQLRKI